MGLDIGGFEQEPDWPKLGGAFLIAACLILAIRTAKWPARQAGTASDRDLEVEIENAVYVAGSVLSKLLAHKMSLFPSRKAPWYAPNDEDVPK